MNKLKYFVVVAIIFALTINLNAAPKKVLIEQFTGAWCGYCPDGSVKMDEILQQYPGKVYGVKFHNGDKMAIPETDIIGAALGLTGYPTGNVDRTPVNAGGKTVIMIDRSAWKQVVEYQLQQTAPVEVKLDWAYDEATGEIIASITGEFDQAVTNEVRFNVYVIEDEVTGSGTGWDQRNYYNNSAGHPYYQKGDPVKNYKHMAVVRATLGGPWGAENSIPLPIPAGTKAKYAFTIKKGDSWNINKIRLIGMVVNYTQNSRQILNSTEGVKIKSNTSITQIGNLLDASPKGTTPTVKFTIKNNNTSAKNYNFNFTKSSSTNWKATFEPNENSVTVPAGGTYEVTMKMPVESYGVGTATLIIEEEGGMSFSKTFKIYASDGEYLSINADPSFDEFVPSVIRSVAAYKDMITIPLNHFSLLSGKFNNLKVANINLGETGEITASDVALYQMLMNKNVNLLFNGTLLYPYLNQFGTSLLNQLGIAYNAQSFQGQSTQGKFNISGVAGDPITDGFASQIQLVSFYTQKARITNPSIASPIITLQGSPDSIYATKHQLTGSRVVCFGINPRNVTNTNGMQQVIIKALNWIYKAPEPEFPQISTVTGIDFGEVVTSTSEEKSFEVKNIGKKDLNITSVTIKGNDASAYSIVDEGMKTLKPNEATIIKVKFTPTAIKFYTNASVEIASNDPNKPVATVSLAGKGKKGEGVVDPVIVNAQVYPNPVESNSQVSFFVPETAKSANLSIIDLSGKKVMEFGNIAIGENSLYIDNKMLEAGSYILVITIDDEIITKRFNVIK